MQQRPPILKKSCNLRHAAFASAPREQRPTPPPRRPTSRHAGVGPGCDLLVLFRRQRIMAHENGEASAPIPMVQSPTSISVCVAMTNGPAPMGHNIPMTSEEIELQVCGPGNTPGVGG